MDRIPEEHLETLQKVCDTLDDCVATIRDIVGVVEDSSDSSEDSAESDKASWLGVNLEEHKYWIPNDPFSNLATAGEWKSISTGGGPKPWSPDGRELDLDEHGWVRSLEPDQYARMVLHKHDPLGSGIEQCLVKFDGAGDITFAWDGSVSEKISENEYLVEVIPSENGLAICIWDVDVEDPLRNIRVYRGGEGEEALPPTLRSEWVEQAKKWAIFRPLDLLGINNSPVTSFSQMSSVRQVWSGSEGVPLAAVVQMCNEAGADLWFNVPHLATDDCVREIAEYLCENLNGSLIVAYSNEVWNGNLTSGFAQAQYCTKRGIELFGDAYPDESQSYLRMLFYVHRSLEIFAIFDEMYENMPEALTRVLETQAANLGYTENMLDLVRNEARLSGKFPTDYVDAVAIAPYISWYAESKPSLEELQEWSAERVILEIEKGSTLQDSLDTVKSNVELCEKYGLPVYCYEMNIHSRAGGEAEKDDHVNEILDGAVSDLRMKRIITNWLEGWVELTGGNPVCWYKDIGPHSSYGRWQIWRYLGEPNGPVANALSEYWRAAE